MGDNDHSYKLLFNNAELVRDLLRGQRFTINA